MTTDIKQELIQRLRLMSIEMRSLGIDMEYYYSGKPQAEHGKEMLGAAVLAKDWADAMEKEA